MANLIVIKEYLCINDCNTTQTNLNIRIFYFKKGTKYKVQSSEHTKYVYVYQGKMYSGCVNNDFIMENFLIAEEDNLALSEIDCLFDTFFFN